MKLEILGRDMAKNSNQKKFEGSNGTIGLKLAFNEFLQPIRVKKSPWGSTDASMALFFALTMADVTTDIVMLVQFFSMGNISWFVAGCVFLFLASLVSCYFVFIGAMGWHAFFGFAFRFSSILTVMTRDTSTRAVLGTKCAIW